MRGHDDDLPTHEAGDERQVLHAVDVGAGDRLPVARQQPQRRERGRKQGPVEHGVLLQVDLAVGARPHDGQASAVEHHGKLPQRDHALGGHARRSVEHHLPRAQRRVHDRVGRAQPHRQAHHLGAQAAVGRIGGLDRLPQRRRPVRLEHLREAGGHGARRRRPDLAQHEPEGARVDVLR